MHDLTSGKVGRQILRFTIPMLIGNVFQQLYNVVDSIVIGKFLGNEALAAVGASFPMIFTLISMIIGLTSGGTIIIAQFFGAKNMDQLRRTIDTLYIFLFVSSFFLSVAGTLISPSL